MSSENIAKKCSTCAKNYPVKYFQTDDSGSELKRCLFCRKNKTELATIIIKRDRHNDRLLAAADKEIDNAAGWRRMATDWQDKFNEQMDLMDDLVKKNKELKNNNHNVCDDVANENRRLKRELKELRRTMEEQLKFETEALRAEIKTLKRKAKRERQKQKKRSPPEEKKDDDMLPPPPSYHEAVSYY